jgi:multidrug resistance efflux pump
MLKLILPGLMLTGIVALSIALDPHLQTSYSADATYASYGASEHEQDGVQAPGCVEGAAEEAQLRPEARGRVTRISIAEGERVEAGAELLVLDSQVQRNEEDLCAAQVQMAEADLQRLINGAHAHERQEAHARHQALEAQLRGAQKRLERTTALRSSNAATQQLVDDQAAEAASLASQVRAAKARLDLLEAPAREDEVHRAEANVAAAKARLALARTQREKMVLRAPHAGTVLKIHAQLGELVGPDSAEPAIILSDLSRIQVRAFVEEFDAPRLQAGIACAITADGLPGETFKGRLVRLAPRMSSKRLWTNDPTEQFDTKVREVWIELEHAEPLPIGLRVDVVLKLPQTVPSRPDD